MKRFQRQTPSLTLAIAACAAVVFGADCYTELGIAVWIFYLVPLALTFFVWKPASPLWVAACCTILIAAGTWLSPMPASEAIRPIAYLNRSFAVVTLWALAFVSRTFIAGKLVLEEKQWIRAGQRDLTTRMQGELSPRQAGDALLKFVCDYLGAPAGVLYTRDGDAVFRRASAYANGPGDTPETLAPGDGLAGETAKDGRLRVLTDLPDGYFRLGSALGGSRPRYLVVAPATADGRVEGVIELALTADPGHSGRELFEAIAEPTGVALRSAHYRSRLQKLLEETQRQAEELQTQQEELRVSNEELEEQGNALRASQAKLEAQQAELDQINAQLEHQVQEAEQQRDELRRAHEELQRKTEDLERAYQYKSEFLANMSHELRTPLNSTLILARLLAENKTGNLTPDQVRYAETIHGAGNDLLALINDVLDLARIEAGQMDLRIEPVPLARAVDEVSRGFREAAGQKGLGFTARVEPGAPETLQTDPQRLQQILRNLLSNAVKFTAQGEVELRVRAAGERVAFSVSDTGIGIPREKQEIIFEAFRQADGSTHRQYGGTGLGLSISRDLATHLGGTLEVQSAPGQGSTFTLTLPRALQQQPRAAVAPQKRPEPEGPPPPTRQEPPRPVPAFPDDRAELPAGARTVLVIEDDARFARILYELAQEQRFRCIVASTAREGLQLARQYAPGAILLDINLPDESGLSVLAQLKADPAMRHIPVHVVSVADHVQRAREMGAVGYAIKPVSREELAQAFARLQRQIDQKVRHVLVVEDDPAQRDNLTELLGSEDVEITAVRSAAAALDALKARTFDCMVMDLALPDLSGYELLDRMEQDPAFSFPPVIVYTGRALTEAEELRLRRYSRSVVIKGAGSPERLLDEVTLFLHRVESKLPAEQRALLQHARSRESIFDGRRVLLVEDDVRNIFALSNALEPKGARVEIARNGKEALSVLDRLPGKIDMVLMDLMMPEMDGLTATREIRKRPGCEKLPIIALTAKAMPDDRERCLAAGANDYIAKPIEMEKLLSLMRVWMRR